MSETTTTEYPVICPPQTPAVENLKKGDKIAELAVVGHDAADPCRVYHCWECGRGFSDDDRPVILTPSDDPDEIRAMHVWCAEDFRKRRVPIVVTVHPDGTASVTGPGDNGSLGMTVTVVIEGK